MDLATFKLLDEMKLKNVEIIPLPSFERMLGLQPVKASRSFQEFCWTCASSLMAYLMPWVGDVTYLDADTYCFGDLKVVFDEIGARSIGITPHRFPPHRKHKEVNGRFNVGLVAARNTDAGRNCISKWASDCREWCFNRVEEHHACGDQLYLDRWESDYPGEVCAIQNIGVNLAPWNLDNYRITEGPCADDVPVTLYHFHEYRDPEHPTNYKLRTQDRPIYTEYSGAWLAAKRRIEAWEVIISARQLEIEMQGQRA